jgi:hypothetical protein
MGGILNCFWKLLVQCFWHKGSAHGSYEAQHTQDRVGISWVSHRSL